MTRTYRMTAGRRFGNIVISALVRARLAPKNYAILTVRGRRTGRPHSTPIRPLEHGGQRYLVAPYGPVDWVHNVRAAGSATLRQGGRTGSVHLLECGATESGPVLKEYVRVVPIVRPYFDAKPEDAAEAFTAEADRHPVFRIAASAG